MNIKVNLPVLNIEVKDDGIPHKNARIKFKDAQGNKFNIQMESFEAGLAYMQELLIANVQHEKTNN